MKGIREEKKGTRRKLKETRGKVKETRGKLKETKGNLESIFWKVVFSTKLPSHETSVSWLKSVLKKCEKTIPQRGCPTRAQNSVNPSQ